jgi:hypothetical protein
VIEISGAVAKSFALALAELATLPRLELTADFHCVAGWSATNLRWEGVAFETFYRMIIEPSVQPGTSVTHIVFGGLDGYRSVVAIDDALAEDLLIAERLDGRPLDNNRWRPGPTGQPPPIRLRQYQTPLPHRAPHRRADSRLRIPAMRLPSPSPGGGVWEQERHRYLPARSVRPIYRPHPAHCVLRPHGNRRSHRTGAR